jgi:hypothetical protein
LLFCVDAAKLPAQGTTRQERQCFSIHVHLNGKPVEGPQAITLSTMQGENTANLEGACFKVLPALLAEKAVDIFSRYRVTRFIYPQFQQASSQVPGASTWKTKSLGETWFSQDMLVREKHVLLFST